MKAVESGKVFWGVVDLGCGCVALDVLIGMREIDVLVQGIIPRVGSCTLYAMIHTAESGPSMSLGR